MTRKLFLATAAATTLVLAAAGAALAMDPSARDAALHDLGFAPSDCQERTTNDTHVLVCRTDSNNDTEHADADEHAQSHGDVDDHHGSFTTTGDVVTGRHVAFHVRADNQTVTDFTSIGPWANGVVFSSITFSNGANASRDSKGDAFTLSSDDWSWRAFDQPDAHWQAHAKENTTMTLVLGPHDNAPVEKNGTLVEIVRNGHAATLRLDGHGASASLSGDTLTLTLPKGTGAEFHIGPMPHPDERSERATTTPPAKPAKPASAGRADGEHDADDK